MNLKFINAIALGAGYDSFYIGNVLDFLNVETDGVYDDTSYTAGLS